MFKNYLNETNIWVLIGTQVLFGISEVPINGIFSELVCEVSYPIAEGTTYNIMNIGPQLWCNYLNKFSVNNGGRF
jgi:hypothetical protein